MTVSVAQTFPLVRTFEGRASAMELASNDLWAALTRLTVDQLKALRPTGPYLPLVDALIAVREIMGD